MKKLQIGNRLTVFFILALLGMLTGALAGAPAANAASDYDDLFTIGSPEIVCDAENIEDITTSYLTYITEAPESSQKTDFLNALDVALDHGSGWALNQNVYSETAKDINFIVSTTPETATTEFYTDGSGNKYLRTNNAISATIYCRGYGTPPTYKLVDFSTSPGYRSLALMQPSSYDVNPVFINFDITYPSGYEGEEVPETLSTPVESEFVPDWEASDAGNWTVNLNDKNFFTFDGIEWTCSEDGNSVLDDGSGLAPVLYWQVWRDDFPTEGANLLIDDGYQSATAPVTVELPINKEEARTYRVAGWYDCGGEVDFTDASNYEFTVDKAGVLDESAALTDCISDEFPFIYLDDCIANLAIFGKIAMFGGTTFNNSWTASTDCTTMVVLDDWLMLQDPVVCPQMPSSVRTVVTPFVTFILGLITMKFLITRTGKDF